MEYKKTNVEAKIKTEKKTIVQRAQLLHIAVYSCFEKGCPTKPYATMPKDIMGNDGSWSFIVALCVSAT